MTEDIRHDLSIRISEQLMIAAKIGTEGKLTSASLAARLVGALTGRNCWDEPLGVHLPGLHIDDQRGIPFMFLSSMARNTVLRLELRTWHDLAGIRPFDIIDLRNVGLTTLTELLRLAVERAITSSGKSCDAQDAVDDVPLESVRPSSNFSRSSLRPDLMEALRTLATWGERETRSRTLGTLLAELIRQTDLPTDIRRAWDIVASSSLSEIAIPATGLGNVTELFEELMSSLDERERAIFVDRSLAPGGPTLQELADRWGLTRERIRQIQGKAESKVTDLIAKERFAPLRWKAHSLRTVLGPTIPMSSGPYEAAIDDAAGGCPVDRRPLLVSILLRLAGYSEEAGWMVREDGALMNFDVLREAADEFGLIDVSRVAELLETAGVAPAHHAAMLEKIGGFRRFGDRMAIWTGSVIDKAVIVLALRGEPASPDELAATIGEGYSVRALRNRLLEDPRLVRVTKNEWGLRVWGLEEYTGVADEIAEEVERQGGAASLHHLMEVLTKRFGIAESSVRAYAQTPRFVVEAGIVRLRAPGEPVIVSAGIADAKGCFQDSPTSVTFCIGVDREVLRGSGRSLPAAVAVFVGLTPGAEQRFRIAQAGSANMLTVVVTWPVDSVVGPTLGSTRALAVLTGAIEGDLLRLRFDRADGTAQVVRLRPRELQEAAPLTRLSALTGLDDLDISNSVDRVATALGVDHSQLRTQLYRRGDGFIAGLLPVPALDPELNAALAELGDALAPKE